MNHQYWMAKALRLAANGLYSTHPNPRVGCIIVYQGAQLAQGWHESTGEAHAEVNAVNSAPIPPGCTFYVTLEPCSHQGKTPPCVDELIRLKPVCVVIAMQDPNPLVAGRGIARLKAAGIDVVCGILEPEARSLNCGFVSRMENKRPYLRLKMASSLDGRTALKNGVSQWITGESARLDVQRLRARSSVILTTARTVADDNPALSVRLTKAELGQTRDVRQPILVIVDSQLTLTGKEKIFTTGAKIWIYTAYGDARAQARLEASGAEVIRLDGVGSRYVDLTQMMAHLATREINEIHTECGQGLAGALIRQELVDEIVLYMAPGFLGSQARGLVELGNITEMNSTVNCEIKEVRKIGSDLRLTLMLEKH